MTQTDDDARRRLFERLAAQANRLETKREAMLRERDRLDRLVADLVTSKPDSAQWWAHPGELTIDDVIGAIGGGYAGLAAAMDRQRKALAERPAAKAKTKGRSSGKPSPRTQARRAAIRRSNQP